jgi:hypothetical protein
MEKNQKQSSQKKSAKGSRHSPSDLSQRERTARNKANQSKKRRNSKEFWIVMGVKKNGKPVKKPVKE